MAIARALAAAQRGTRRATECLEDVLLRLVVDIAVALGRRRVRRPLLSRLRTARFLRGSAQASIAAARGVAATDFDAWRRDLEAVTFTDLENYRRHCGNLKP